MNCLTLTQPWATLVAIGAKAIETRSWGTPYRGPLAIHAAKTFPVWARDYCGWQAFRAALQAVGITGWQQLPTGVVLCTCTLQGCKRVEQIVIPIGNERSFGDYSEGRWAWLLGDVVAFDTPVPARGALGLWSWEQAA